MYQEYINQNSDEIRIKLQRIMDEVPTFTIENNTFRINFESTRKIQNLMSQMLIPGLSIAVVNSSTCEWAFSCGFLNNHDKKPVLLTSKFESGSTTKLITAILAMKCVEEKLIDLNEPIYTKLKTWSYEKDERFKLITLKHLLIHTAGINRPDSMFSYENDKTVTLNEVLNGSKPAINDPLVIEFDPGSSHKYSNLGYLLIQKVIEDISNESFSSLAKRLIFDVLGMKDSFFTYPITLNLAEVSSPHDKDGNVGKHSLHPVAFACGGLITTAFDLAQLMIEISSTFQNKSGKILCYNSIKEIIASHSPLEKEKYFGFTGQGLGCLIKNVDGDIVLCQPGTNIQGMTCMFIMNVNKGQGVISMSNSINGEILNLLLLSKIQEQYKWDLFNL